MPFVRHVASAGAAIVDLGTAHGVRSFGALGDGQFMLFVLAPDGRSAVSGALTELSVDQLRSVATGNVVDLPTRGGFAGLFVRSGPRFQVFYATPDGGAVVPGVMYDADGKDLTRQQVARIPGAIPEVVVGSPAAPPAGAHDGLRPSALTDVEAANSGAIGPATAPHLWMVVDPQCSFSVRAFRMLEPFVAAGRLRLSVVPLSILDAEDQGLSTRVALSLLSQPPDRMVAAWRSGDVAAAPAPDAASKLRANAEVGRAIGLQGTPTFLWRRRDGSEGRLDGMPANAEALVASVGN